MFPKGSKPIPGAVHKAGTSTTFYGYARARTSKCQRITKDAEELTTGAKKMRKGGVNMGV